MEVSGLGDGFGNEVIDQWESEQIGGLAHRVYVAFAFCCTFWCFPALNSCCISPDLRIISKANKKESTYSNKCFKASESAWPFSRLCNA